MKKEQIQVKAAAKYILICISDEILFVDKKT